jgi:hypothetical protein
LVDTNRLSIDMGIDNVGQLNGLLSDGSSTDDSSPLLSGSMGQPLLPGQTLAVFREDGNGQFVQVGLAEVEGSAWRFQDSGLADGEHVYKVQVKDASGLVAQPSDTFSLVVDATAPTAPVIDIPEASEENNFITPTEAVSNAGVPVVTTLPADAVVGDILTTVVTAPDGSSITLTATLTATDIDAGVVSQTVPTAFVEPIGAYATSTTLTSAINGLSSTPVPGDFTVIPDTTNPVIAIDAVIEGDNRVNAVEDNDVVISGTTTAEAGQVVTVILTDSTNPTQTVTKTAVVQADGTWALTGTQVANVSTWANGTIEVTASVSNAAGLPSETAAKSLTLDNATPALTIATTLEGDNRINAAEDNDLVVSVTTTAAEAGQVVTVVLTDSTNPTQTVTRPLWLRPMAPGP